ncbi:MAG: hypothetical protein ACRC1K_09025 [Planctomycetia bacterium]
MDDLDRLAALIQAARRDFDRMGGPVPLRAEAAWAAGYVGVLREESELLDELDRRLLPVQLGELRRLADDLAAKK